MGIEEKPPEYNSLNPLHFFVSNQGNCDNGNNNGKGSPEAPLCHFPNVLPASAYVEIHGGQYKQNHSAGSVYIRGQGTSERPIYIKGFNNPIFNKRTVFVTSEKKPEFIILEGINFQSSVAIPGPAKSYKYSP